MISFDENNVFLPNSSQAYLKTNDEPTINYYNANSVSMYHKITESKAEYVTNSCLQPEIHCK